MQKPLCFLFERLMQRKSAGVSTALKMSCICGVVKNNNSVSSMYSRSHMGCPADSQHGGMAWSMSWRMNVSTMSIKIRAKRASLLQSRPYSTRDVLVQKPV